MTRSVSVAMGEIRVSGNPFVELVAYALGSCVGIIAYDAQQRIGGIHHVMLAHASMVPAKAECRPSMFADTGFPLLVQMMRGRGARSVSIRLVGGACSLGGEAPFAVGKNNIEAVQALVQQSGLPVVGSDLGGSVARTVRLAIDSGVVTIAYGDGKARNL